MVDKEAKTTSKDMQAEVQGPSASVPDHAISWFLTDSGLRVGLRCGIKNIQKKNKKKLVFSKIQIDNPQFSWENENWSFLNFKSHHLYVHREKNEEKNIIYTVTQGGGLVMSYVRRWVS